MGSWILGSHISATLIFIFMNIQHKFSYNTDFFSSLNGFKVNISKITISFNLLDIVIDILL